MLKNNGLTSKISTMLIVFGGICGSQTVFAAQSNHKPAGAPVYCNGYRITIWGSGSNDAINGSRHNDVIWAGAGNDRVNGRGGMILFVGERVLIFCMAMRVMTLFLVVQGRM